MRARTSAANSCCRRRLSAADRHRAHGAHRLGRRRRARAGRQRQRQAAARSRRADGMPWTRAAWSSRQRMAAANVND
ncbi:MAG: hypothetical protein MZW92_45445 [Comamonadaceae bacterium]|nr:hypothetical protein [Comamonadaceae bacterium]